MKKYFTTILSVCALFAAHSSLHAQNTSVGIGGSPDASAQLDIKSTSGGLLIPRMNSSLRQAIPAPANGLMVYDTDTKSFWNFANGKWDEVHLPLPYKATASSFTPLLSIQNTHSISQTALQVTALSGNAVKGSTGGTYSGIFGQNNENGKGVTGHNTASGIGVYARGQNGTALFADILNGYGDAGYLKQVNNGGKALEVLGNVRIHGGNTAEGIGKNFICTNNGAGFWIMPPSGRIHAGFVCKNFAGNGLNSIPNNTWGRYHPATIEYNFTNGFNTPAQSPSSTFICPVNGFYKFNARVYFNYNYQGAGGLSEYVRKNGLRLMIKRNGVTSSITENIKDYFPYRVLRTSSLSIETHKHLQAGDEIWLEVMQERQYALGAGGPSVINFTDGRFSGNIVWADAQ